MVLYMHVCIYVYIPSTNRETLIEFLFDLYLCTFIRLDWIKNQPIGTARRRFTRLKQCWRNLSIAPRVSNQREARARLPRIWGKRRGRCAHAWHRVNIRVSSSFEGGTVRTVRKRKRGEREGENEQANERRGLQPSPCTVIVDCTSTGVSGLAGLYTSNQNKERGCTVP